MINHTPHQKVENTKTEHRERDADVPVVVEEIEHSDTQAAATNANIIISFHPSTSGNMRTAVTK